MQVPGTPNDQTTPEPDAPPVAAPVQGFDPAGLAQGDPTATDTASFQAGEQSAGIAPTLGQKRLAMAGQVLESMPIGLPGYVQGAIPRMVQDAMESAGNALGGTVKLTAEEANQKYPNLPVKFSEPVYPSQAALIDERNTRRQQNQAWIDRGPETGWGSSLAAGMASGLDPLVLLGSGAVGGALVKGATLARGAIGAVIPELAAGLPAMPAVAGAARVAPSIAKEIGTVFGSNVAINAVAQLPGYIQAGRDQQIQDVKGEAVNAVAGAVFGTGLHFLLHSAARAIERMPKSVREKALKAAIDQHESGARTDMTPAVEAQALREAGAVTPGTVDAYVPRILVHPSEAHFYLPLDADTGGNARMGDSFVMENDAAAHMSDNPAVARNAAGTPESPMQGEVQRLAIRENAKILNLDSQLPKPILAEASRILRAAGVVLDKADEDAIWAMAGREVIQMIRDLPAPENGPTPLELVKTAAGREGYHGYSFTSPHEDNRLILWDHSQMEHQESYVPEKSKIPQMTHEQAAAQSELAHAPENQRFTSEAAKTAALEAPAKVETQEAADTRFTEEEAASREILDQHIQETGDAEIQAEMDRIDAEADAAKRLAEGVELLVNCVRKTG